MSRWLAKSDVDWVASTAVPGRAATIMYALGWTQHSIGAQILRTGAMVQLLLGNIDRLAFAGHLVQFDGLVAARVDDFE